MNTGFKLFKSTSKELENIFGIDVYSFECYVFICVVLGVVDDLILVCEPAMSCEALMTFFYTYYQFTPDAHAL